MNFYQVVRWEVVSWYRFLRHLNQTRAPFRWPHPSALVFTFERFGGILVKVSSSPGAVPHSISFLLIGLCLWPHVQLSSGLKLMQPCFSFSHSTSCFLYNQTTDIPLCASSSSHQACPSALLGLGSTPSGSAQALLPFPECSVPVRSVRSG